MKTLIQGVLLFTLAANVGRLPSSLAAPKIPSVIQSLPGPDSTIFKLIVDPAKSLGKGKVFTVRLHVSPGRGWKVYSSKMKGGEGPVPLTVSLPRELGSLFRIEHAEEIGTPVITYDSDFAKEERSYSRAFEIVLTVLALRHFERPPNSFRVLINYQACSDRDCLRPRTVTIFTSKAGQKRLRFPLRR